MLWIIGLFLTMLWIWGVISHQTLGGYATVLLVVAIISICVGIITRIRQV